jgi:hypothetical protein
VINITVIEKFIYTYALFLIYFTFMISLGAGTLGLRVGLEPPTIPEEPSVWDYVAYPIKNVGFFFRLMMADVGIGILGLLVYAPAIIILIYAVLRLLRGGG